MPTENELAGARFQGRHVAEVADKLGGALGDVRRKMPEEEAEAWDEPRAVESGNRPATH